MEINDQINLLESLVGEDNMCTFQNMYSGIERKMAQLDEPQINRIISILDTRSIVISKDNNKKLDALESCVNGSTNIFHAINNSVDVDALDAHQLTRFIGILQLRESIIQ